MVATLEAAECAQLTQQGDQCSVGTGQLVPMYPPCPVRKHQQTLRLHRHVVLGQAGARACLQNLFSVQADRLSAYVLKYKTCKRQPECNPQNPGCAVFPLGGRGRELSPEPQGLESRHGCVVQIRGSCMSLEI